MSTCVSVCAPSLALTLPSSSYIYYIIFCFFYTNFNIFFTRSIIQNHLPPPSPRLATRPFYNMKETSQSYEEEEEENNMKMIMMIEKTKRNELNLNTKTNRKRKTIFMHI